MLCEKAEPILGSHPVDIFLHYAFYSHYTKLRPLTLEMLKSQLKKGRAKLLPGKLRSRHSVSQ